MNDRIEHCSFCDKAADETVALVRGPAEANICDACILVATQEVFKRIAEEAES